MSSSLVIPVERIESPRQRFERPLARALLDRILEDAPAWRAAGEATLVVHLTRVGGRDVLVEGRAELALTSACRRCLKPVASEVPVVFTLELVARATGATRRGDDDTGEGRSSASFDDGDADREPFDGENVDLAPIAREQLLLGLPSIEPVCAEGCRGLCPACGQDLNERDCGHGQGSDDPRWAKLKALKV